MSGCALCAAAMTPANVTLSYGLGLAENEARSDRGIANAIKVYDGKCTYMGVAEVLRARVYEKLKV